MIIILIFLSFSLQAFVAVTGGAMLDIAPYGLEAKYLSAGATFQTDTKISIGIKPQFSFNNDTFHILCPAVMGIRFPLSVEKEIVLSPYGGGGIFYYGSANELVPLISGGFSLRIKHLLVELPVNIFFHEGDSDTLIGLNLGWVFQY